VRAFKSVGGEPLFFESAQGALLTSVDDKTYVDFCQSFGPNILGHCDPEVKEVVHKAIDTAWSVGASEPYSLQLAEWITERIPWVERLRFVSSGTEAVMSALRLARGFTRREKIVKFEGCYHGHVDSMLVKAGSGLAGLAASDSAGVSEKVASDTIVVPLNNEDALKKAFSEHGAEIAAVILEPLPANFGLLVQREEFLKTVVNTARAAGSLVIFDEVITGFRVKMGGMAETLNIQPDLVTYGKVIGGGFPVGCYGGRGEIMDQVAPLGPVYQAGTLSANPVGMQAGLATLKKVERDGVIDKLEARTKKWSQSLNEIFQRHQSPLRVTHQGSLFWIHKSKGEPIRAITDFVEGHAEGFSVLFHACLNAGIYLAPSSYEVGFLSWAHTDEILGEVLERFDQAVKESHV